MHSSPAPACARDECPAGVAKAFTKLVHETSALLGGDGLAGVAKALCTKTSALLGGDGLAGVAKPSETLHETSALLEGTDLLESESSRKTGLLLPQKMVDAPDEEEIAMRMCVLW